MKGDFTRFTHDKKKQYTGVLKQQGRVELDEDVNENVMIRSNTKQIETKGGSTIPVMIVIAIILGAIAGALAGLAVQALSPEEEEDTPIVIKDDKVGIGTDDPATELDVDGVITAVGGNSDQWNTAYSWGDHSTAGYLTSYTETDPVYGVSAASGISSVDITDWNTAHSWGDHLTVGYLTSFTETDPVYGTSAASGISSGNITNWNTAHSWGDHSTQGYLTSMSETDPVYGASAASGISSGDITNWDTAYGWGDHALAGYDTTVDSWTGTGDVYTTSGNVSIGTVSPNEKLTVEGVLSLGETTAPSATAGYGKLYVKSSNSKLFFQDDSGTEYDLTVTGGIGGSGTANYIPKFTAGNTLGNSVIYETGGNIGIGTISPSTKLHVNGVITALGGNSSDWNTAYSWGDHTSAGYLTGESDPIFATSAAAGIASGDINNWDTAYGWGDHALAGYDTTVDSWTGTGDVYTTSGNVSIGTVSPNEKLTVEGVLSLGETTAPSATAGYGKLYVKSSNSKLFFQDDGGTEYDLTVTGGIGGSGTANYIPKFTAGNTLGNSVIYETGGNIGIGTISPEVKLDVDVGSEFFGVGGAATIGSSNNLATGDHAIAMGYNTTASGWWSTSMGIWTVAYGSGSTAMGLMTNASGDYSIAMGYSTHALAWSSTAMGASTFAYGESSTAMGDSTVARGEFSTAMGRGTDANGRSSTAMGYQTNANGNYSTTMGSRITAEGDYSFGIGLAYNINGWTITQANTMAIMGGNVGIGTVSPENTLHVNGTINLDPIPAPANPSTGFVIYVDEADGDLKAKSSTGIITVLATD